MSDTPSPHTATVVPNHAFINQRARIQTDRSMGWETTPIRQTTFGAFIAVKALENWILQESTINANGVGGFDAYLSTCERRIEMAR
jgi:hypothetical protein